MRIEFEENNIFAKKVLGLNIHGTFEKRNNYNLSHAKAVKSQTDKLNFENTSKKPIYFGSNKVYTETLLGSAKPLVGSTSYSNYSISRRSWYIDEGSTAVFRIYRTGNRSGSGYVRFYTSDGTARSGYDYTRTTRLVYFKSGQ